MTNRWILILTANFVACAVLDTAKGISPRSPGKVLLIPADNDKIPILETQEEPSAGFMHALQNLESAIGNTQSEIDIANNALADLQASLSNLGISWPAPAPRAGEIKEISVPPSDTAHSHEITELRELPKTHLGKIELDSQKASLVRIDQSFETFKNAMRQAKSWDDKGLRANKKCVRLLEPYNHEGFKRLAEAMLAQLRYSNRLKELERGMSTWDSMIYPQFSARSKEIANEWRAERLRDIKSSSAT